MIAKRRLQGDHRRRRPDEVTNAIVLIEAERNALSTLGGLLADIDGVAEAYSVTGPWDFVAVVRVSDHERLADVVTAKIGQLPGVSRTQTMVAFAAYSKHDLEALFSIGETPTAR
jgi:DNA-binding Lrp family transcriptional regulator